MTKVPEGRPNSHAMLRSTSTGSYNPPQCEISSACSSSPYGSHDGRPHLRPHRHAASHPHGREVAIPKLIGMTPTEAEAPAPPPACMILIGERQFYSHCVPEGKIMTQMPLPGTKVRRGWSVRVAQSLGPLRIPIPDVTGGGERIAELNIRRRSLTIGSVAHINLPDASADRVISQNPPPNATGVAAQNQSANKRWPRPPDLRDAQPDRPTHGQCHLALQDAGMKVGKVSIQPPPLQPEQQTATPIAASIPSEPSAASMIVTQSLPPAKNPSRHRHQLRKSADFFGGAALRRCHECTTF